VTGFLGVLAGRTLGLLPVLQPRPPSRFEPRDPGWQVADGPDTATEDGDLTARRAESGRLPYDRRPPAESGPAGKIGYQDGLLPTGRLLPTGPPEAPGRYEDARMVSAATAVATGPATTPERPSPVGPAPAARPAERSSGRPEPSPRAAPMPASGLPERDRPTGAASDRTPADGQRPGEVATGPPSTTGPAVRAGAPDDATGGAEVAGVSSAPGSPAIGPAGGVADFRPVDATPEDAAGGTTGHRSGEEAAGGAPRVRGKPLSDGPLPIASVVSAEAPPEAPVQVVISIGRVELRTTARPPAAPDPGPPPDKPAAPLSLDDYLARRSRR
jgi:hypothetical protein